MTFSHYQIFNHSSSHDWMMLKIDIIFYDFILWFQFEKQVWNKSETICDSQKYLCFGLWWSHDGACLYGRRVQFNNLQKVSFLNFPCYFYYFYTPIFKCNELVFRSSKDPNFILLPSAFRQNLDKINSFHIQLTISWLWK